MVNASKFSQILFQGLGHFDAGRIRRFMSNGAKKNASRRWNRSWVFNAFTLRGAGLAAASAGQSGDEPAPETGGQVCRPDRAGGGDGANSGGGGEKNYGRNTSY